MIQRLSRRHQDNVVQCFDVSGNYIKPCIGQTDVSEKLPARRLHAFRSPRLPLLAIARYLSTQTRAAIDQAIASKPVILFMKGTPEIPQCGYSRATIQLLGQQGVDPKQFSAFNVLEDDDLRQGKSRWQPLLLAPLTLVIVGIKEYSDWPTIPQLYVHKDFVGGCDILLQMHKNGELSKLLEEKDVLVAPEESSDIKSLDR